MTEQIQLKMSPGFKQMVDVNYAIYLNTHEYISKAGYIRLMITCGIQPPTA